MNRDTETIYMDHAATAPLDPAVLDAMMPWLSDRYGNASSMHGAGYEARAAVDRSRATVATVLGCNAGEVLFTGGGTESANLALQGVMRQQKTGHLVVSAIEHPAVLDTARGLEQMGYTMTVVPPERNGIVSAAAVLSAIQPDTVLVSVMAANNEIGTVQPLAEIAAGLAMMQDGRDRRIVFHTDACQASGALSLMVDDLGVDLLTLNASKMYGPKGVGVLYVRNGVVLQPLLFGGGQERAVRPGTEDVAAIVGCATALEIAEGLRVGVGGTESEPTRLQRLRDYAIGEIHKRIPDAELNGDAADRLPNNVHMYFPGVDAQTLLVHLDAAGVYASIGSACAAGTVEPSHVMQAIGRKGKEAMRSIRFTLGRSTTQEQVDRVVEVLATAVKKIR